MFSRSALLVFVALTASKNLVITDWYLCYRLPMKLLLAAYAGVAYSGWLRRACA